MGEQNTPSGQEGLRRGGGNERKEGPRAADRRTQIGVIATIAVLATGFAAFTTMQGGSDPSAAAGLLTGPPPWPAQSQGLNQRVAALGFPPVGDESYHAHALLTVYRDGQQVPVPEDLGFDERGAHASLHTHTPDGVIHMEADNPYPYELGHVFQVWGVAFGPDRLGGDTPSADKRVYVYVNGQPAPAGPVVLKNGDNIVVAYGTEGSFNPRPPDDALNSA